MRDGEALHPNDGEMITCLRSAAHGGRFEFEMLLEGSHDAPPMHAHDGDEEIAIVEGQLEIRFARERKVVGPGERILIPAGVFHTFRNVQPDKRVLARGTHSPYFERLCDQFRDGGGFLHLAVTLCTPEGRRHFQVTRPLRAAIELAGWFGRLRGIRPRGPLPSAPHPR